MSIADALAATPVSSLDLTRFVAVPVDASVAATVESMCDAGRSCACIVDGPVLVGIFTQRDALLRVIGRPSTWDRPIAEVMTKQVRTMLDAQCVSDGLAIMNDWWVRSVPVLDADEQLVGNLSFHTVMATIGKLVAARIGETANEPGVEHGLTFIDFTGLNTSPPVVVGMDDTIETAAHHMKARGIGSALAVDDREHLVGVLTEFDLQMRIGCDQADLSNVAVKEVMTRDPVTLSTRAPIADAIREVIEHQFSYVPLVGESGRPVGVASFRDIATYVETSLEALG